MTPDKSETSYPCQMLTPSQESINNSITKAESMDNMDSDILNLIDVLEEVLFQDYLLPTLDVNSLKQC